MNSKLPFLFLTVLGCGSISRLPIQNLSEAIQHSRELSEEEKQFYALACNEEYEPVHLENSFEVEGKKLNSNNWMNGLDGSKKLNQFNIPGSHDSLAYNISDAVKKYAQCQYDSLRDQLENGIRIFDIRLFYDKDKDDTFCCHGKDIFQCNCRKKNSDELISYAVVLSTIANFLKEHPSETVIIAPKHESGNKKLTNKHINLVHEKLKKLGILYTENRVPTLNEVRGMMVLWDKKDALDGGMKILTNSDSFSKGEYAGVKCEIQKKFNTTPEEKVRILREFFEKIEKSDYQDPNSLYINYVSGFYRFLLLPDSKAISDEVNPEIKNHTFKEGYVYGWFIGDHVDVDYAKAIYESNFYKNPSRGIPSVKISHSPFFTTTSSSNLTPILSS